MNMLSHFRAVLDAGVTAPIIPDLQLRRSAVPVG
jgi:hypothetical protein